MITAKVPRTDCPEHGVKRMAVPWARDGSGFTLLFERAALMLVREMPVLAAARILEITDKRLWRIVEHYVGKDTTAKPSKRIIMRYEESVISDDFCCVINLWTKWA